MTEDEIGRWLYRLKQWETNESLPVFTPKDVAKLVDEIIRLRAAIGYRQHKEKQDD